MKLSALQREEINIPNEYYMYGVVLLALSVIVGLFMTIGRPIISLNSTLTESLTKMQMVERQVNGFTESNRESHKRLHERIDNVEDDVTELRLKVHSSNKN